MHTGETHTTPFTYTAEKTLFTQKREKDNNVIQRERHEAELLQDWGKPQVLTPTTREEERFLDGCRSSKRCLRDNRGQEEKIGRGEREGHTAQTLMCLWNKQTEG